MILVLPDDDRPDVEVQTFGHSQMDLVLPVDDRPDVLTCLLSFTLRKVIQ